MNGGVEGSKKKVVVATTTGMMRKSSMLSLVLLVLLYASSGLAARCTFFDGTPNECKAFFKPGYYSYYVPDGYNVTYIEVSSMFFVFDPYLLVEEQIDSSEALLSLSLCFLLLLSSNLLRNHCLVCRYWKTTTVERQLQGWCVPPPFKSAS